MKKLIFPLAFIAAGLALIIGSLRHRPRPRYILLSGRTANGNLWTKRLPL